MALRLFLFLLILLSSSCEKDIQELMISRTPYTGSNLRIDGYYFSARTLADGIPIAIFYRDGVCFHCFFGATGASDTLKYIETEILLDEGFINKLKSEPSCIGVYQVAGNSLTFETWERVGSRKIITFSHFAEILNDTTFFLRKRVNNDQNVTREENIIYRFKKFSPKPDSTNTFIK